MTGVTTLPGPPSETVTDLLELAARGIHGERDRDRMVAWAAEALAVTAAADVAAVCLLGEPGPPTWSVPPASETALADLADLAALGDPRNIPAIAAALAGEPGSAAADETLRRALRLADLRLLVVPRADGGVHGVALLAWRAEGIRIDLTPDDGTGPPEEPAWTRAATALLAHLGVALDNHAAMADLEAVQRDIVHKLQEAVRPPTPPLRHTELGVYYQAADRRASTGGDLYDWIVLPDGDLHLTVVDVMGKGVEATKDAVAVTHAVRLLVLDGCPLERVVARADALVTAQNPELVATLVIGRYDPDTGTLRLAGGGHPPPLLVSPRGEVRAVEVGGIPIGFPGAGSEGEVQVTLDRSDTVVFYTDGLIETTKDIVKGLEALIHHAQDTATYPAVPMARAIVERAQEGAVRDDDSLALVLRRRSPPSDTPRLPLAPFEYRFTPSTAAVPLTRHLLKDWLVRVPVASEEAYSLTLVASELCANAVRHATGARGGVVLRARVDGADIVVEVEDDGGSDREPLPPSIEDPPDPMAERGRGLFLVRALTDGLSCDVSPRRTVIRVVRRAVVAREGAPG